MNIRRRKRQRKLPPSFAAPLCPYKLSTDRCSTTREDASRRILIMRVGSYGDILMGTPLLPALRAYWPDAHITWLVEYNEREAIEANPFVDEVLLWDSGYFKRLAKAHNSLMWVVRALQFRAELRRRRYDVFISFQPEEWPLLLRGMAAPTTIGVFDTFRQFTGVTKTSPYARLYTHPYTYDDLPLHRTDQYLLPLKALGIPAPAEKKMVMGFTAEDDAAVTQFLAGQGVESNERLVVLAPMTTWPSRCWEGGRYAELADALEERGVRVVLIGSARRQEAEIVKGIAAQMRKRPIEALGVLTFRQVAALIARSSVLVSGDTGPMHVAAAVGTPYIALFGPTPVAGRAPLAGRGITLMHPVPCGPCDQEFCPNQGEDHMRCMRLITVQEVLTEAERLLGEPVPA